MNTLQKYQSNHTDLPFLCRALALEIQLLLRDDTCVRAQKVF